MGLGRIELVSHSDDKGSGDDSYVLDCRVRVSLDFEVRWELDPDSKRHWLVHRPLNDGNLRAGSQRGNIRPFKIRRRDQRVPVLGSCIRLMDQDDAKSAQ